MSAGRKPPASRARLPGYETSQCVLWHRLQIAGRRKKMSKFSFDPKTLGFVTREGADVRSPSGSCAFQPFVSSHPGIEAIKEIASLTNIEWGHHPAGDGLTNHIDT